MARKSPDSAAEGSEPTGGGNKPIHRVQYGNVSGAVFAHTRTRQDGGEYQDYSISLQRSYRDQEGEWQRSSISFYRREIMAAVEALGECFKASYEAGQGQSDDEADE